MWDRWFRSCCGVALSFKLRREPQLAITYIGDGSVRTAEFHEGMNFAAVQRLPFIAVVQNNQIALGTRVETHSLSGTLESLAAAYGCEGPGVRRQQRSGCVRGD